MLDLLYLALTVGFFALMLAYVRGCARLGGSAGADEAAAAAPAGYDDAYGATTRGRP